MAKKDITNRQLLDALTLKFDKRFDGLETRFDNLEGRMGSLETRFSILETRFNTLGTRFDNLEEMVAGIKDTLVDKVVDVMATSEELNEGIEELQECAHADFDDLEVRLGRRLDSLRYPASSAKKRKFIAAKVLQIQHR